MIGLPMSVVATTCKLEGGEKQCRYLAVDTKREDFFRCMKTQTHEKKIIDGEVEAFLARYRAATAKKNHGLPVGDNCPGFREEEHHEPT